MILKEHEGEVAFLLFTISAGKNFHRTGEAIASSVFCYLVPRGQLELITALKPSWRNVIVEFLPRFTLYVFWQTWVVWAKLSSGSFGATCGWGVCWSSPPSMKLVWNGVMDGWLSRFGPFWLWGTSRSSRIGVWQLRLVLYVINLRGVRQPRALKPLWKYITEDFCNGFWPDGL